jgi:O-antigen/teichoic acid export membrane protein
MLKIVIRNAASNWAGYAVYALIGFFLTPFVLHSLGDARYGIWVLIGGVTGYYGLLDLGFRSGITQYLTRHLASRDFAQMNRAASAAFVGLAACGGLVLLISVVLCALASRIFTIPADAVFETRCCILIFGLSAASSFLFFPFSAVFVATQRYDISNAVGISVRLVGAAATLACLKLGYGLIGLSIVQAAVEFAGYTVRWRLAYRILPELKISPRLDQWRDLWVITSFGFWMVLIGGSNQLGSYSEVAVLGLLVPVAAIAPFAVASSLVGNFDRFFSPMVIVLYPAATHLDARGDIQALRKLYLLGSRVLLLFPIGLAMVGVAWADDFFRLWIGPQPAEGAPGTSVVLLFDLLIVAAVVSVSQRVGYQLLLAARRVKTLACLQASEALGNVCLSVGLILAFGVVGSALGTLIAIGIVEGLVYPLVICRIFQIPYRTYACQVYPRPIVAAAVLAACLIAIRYLIPDVAGWGTLILVGLLACSILVISATFIGLASGERRRFVFEPLGRLWCRLRLTPASTDG